MLQFIQQLKYKPEPVKRRIFIVSMIVFIAIMVALYIFSIRNSVAHSLDESASGTLGMPGEFKLPGLKESISANVKDLLTGIKNKE